MHLQHFMFNQKVKNSFAKKILDSMLYEKKLPEIPPGASETTETKEANEGTELAEATEMTEETEVSEGPTKSKQPSCDATTGNTLDEALGKEKPPGWSTTVGTAKKINKNRIEYVNKKLVNPVF